MHGYLRTASRLADDAFRFDDAVRHFRNFSLKKFYKELRVRTSEADERAPCAFVNAEKQGAHALALTIPLTRYLFVVGEYRRRTAEVDVQISALEALDMAGHYLALALAVFGNDGSALRFADFLHDDLLCGLRGDAAEIIVRFEWEGYLLVEHGVFFDASRVFNHDVLFGIEARTVVVIAQFFVLAAHERFVDDYLCLAEFHVARLGVEVRADYLPAFAVFAAVCSGERCCERVNNTRARNAALLLELVEGGVQ